MPRTDGAHPRYHHGDLPAALRAAAVDLVSARGPSGFSLAEAARRAGVTSAAPYRHFSDREALLASVACEAYDELAARLAAAGAPGGPRGPGPRDRLVGMVVAYVGFAVDRRASFQVLFSAGIDKSRHPEVRAAGDRALAVVDAVVAELDDALPGLTMELWAVAHGYASLLTGGDLEAHDVDAEQVSRLASRSATRLLGRDRPAAGR